VDVNVSRVDVAVYDPARVAVGQRGRDLCHDRAHRLLGRAEALRGQPHPHRRIVVTVVARCFSFFLCRCCFCRFCRCFFFFYFCRCGCFSTSTTITSGAAAGAGAVATPQLLLLPVRLAPPPLRIFFEVCAMLP
jgi:hypothetical protein